MSSIKLKEIDQQAKYKIAGFCRYYEEAFRITIPIMIQYLIIVYHWIQEKWTRHEDSIELDNNNKIARKKISASWGYDTIYGNNAIDANDKSIIMYKWKLKLTKKSISGGYPIFIGIAPSNNEDAASLRPFIYGYHSWMAIDHTGREGKWCDFYELQTGDHLSLILRLDMIQRKLFCKMDTEQTDHEHELGDDIDLVEYKWNFAIALCNYIDVQQEVELVEFDVIQQSIDNVLTE